MYLEDGDHLLGLHEMMSYQQFLCLDLCKITINDCYLLLMIKMLMIKNDYFLKVRKIQKEVKLSES